jgi:hypothetical protein
MMVELTERLDERVERENTADVMMLEERDHDSVVDSEEGVSQSRRFLSGNLSIILLIDHLSRLL